MRASNPPTCRLLEDIGLLWDVRVRLDKDLRDVLEQVQAELQARYPAQLPMLFNQNPYMQGGSRFSKAVPQTEEPPTQFPEMDFGTANPEEIEAHLMREIELILRRQGATMKALHSKMATAPTPSEYYERGLVFFVNALSNGTNYSRSKEIKGEPPAQNGGDYVIHLNPEIKNYECSLI